MRAWATVLKLVRLSNSHSSVAKQVSLKAWSKQSPTELIDGCTPASLQR